ncbi:MULTISPECIES: hypothetical protein [unclassified Mesorhizobium]|uniref:hypothetical protein n=1 Tax=unclassified Mesorhizobium TaxID=325217 RepID=UPI0033359A63
MGVATIASSQKGNGKRNLYRPAETLSSIKNDRTDSYAKWLFVGALDGGFVDLGLHLVVDGFGLPKPSIATPSKPCSMFLPVSWHLTLLAILARLGAVHPGVGGAFLIFLRHGHLHHPPGNPAALRAAASLRL